MGEAMKKDVRYEVKLQSSVSPEMFEDPVTGQTLHKTRVEAAVAVTDITSGMVCFLFVMFIVMFY